MSLLWLDNPVLTPPIPPIMYGEQVRYVGAIASTWINQDNALGPEDNIFTTDTVGAYQPTAQLFLSQFGFSIPELAIIDGLRVEYRVKASNQAVCASLYALKNGVYTGYQNANTEEYLPIASAAWMHGLSDLPTDMWGTDWYPADFNQEVDGFEVRLTFQNRVGSTQIIFLDSVRATVYYHLE